MLIAYFSGYGSWWGNFPKDVYDRDYGRMTGAGEQGMVRSAFGLAAMGHEVTLYSCAEPGEYKNVRFVPERDFYREVPGGDADAIVAWSDPSPLSLAPAGCARLLVQQLNDLVFAPGWEVQVDCLVSPSWNHADLMARLGWAGLRAVMHNGCFPEQWADAPHPSERPMQVGYWSSPDRGLHHVLRCWPRIRRAVPDARLVVGYEIERLFGHVSPLRRDWAESPSRIALMRDYVLAARHDPSITFLGGTSHPKLREVQKQTRVFCYPSDGILYTEGFSVACLEAMAAGCLPVLRGADALPSLWTGAAWWTPMDTGTTAFDDALVDLVVHGLTQWSERPESLSLDDLRARAAEFPWSRSVQEMAAAIDEARVVRRAREAA